MAKIKQVRFPRQRRLMTNDASDRAFWDEFFRLEQVRSMREDTANGKGGRLVTIKIKDEASGEEWVIEKVWLSVERVKEISN